MNFHRPCGFATVVLDPRGKHPAEQYRTPYEKLVSLPGWEHFLKPSLTASGLQQQATR